MFTGDFRDPEIWTVADVMECQAVVRELQERGQSVVCIEIDRIRTELRAAPRTLPVIDGDAMILRISALPQRSQQRLQILVAEPPRRPVPGQ